MMTEPIEIATAVLIVLACSLLSTIEAYSEYVPDLEGFETATLQSPQITEAQLERGGHVRDAAGTAPPTTGTPSPNDERM